MAGVKWTPGPWWVDEDHNDAAVCERGMVADMEIGCPREEWAANARLIAKAPAMYDILARLLEDLPRAACTAQVDMRDVRALLAEIDGEAG